MSDSDDFGGFGETTPTVPRKAVRPSHSNAAIAGPSRTADNKRIGVHAPMSINSDDDEIQEVRTKNKRTGGVATGKRRRKEDEDEDKPEELDVQEVGDKRRQRRREETEEEGSVNEEVQEIVVRPPNKKGRGDSRKPVSRMGKGGESKVNGVSKGVTSTPATTKGKGKAKASRQADVEEVEFVDLDEEEIRTEIEGIANAINLVHRPGKQSSSRAKQVERDDENSRLREQLRQANAHIEDLKRQLEELHKLKYSEPEALIQRMETQYRSERQAHDTVVHDLTEQLSRKNPLARIGRNPFTQLLTREEADKEMQGLREQCKSYKTALQERDEELKKREDENGKLQTSVQDLRYELQLEIERSKSLIDKASTRKPLESSSHKPRGRVLGQSDDPKMSELVKFYEDLTNVLIVDVKPQASRHQSLEEWVITCLYSHQDVVDKSKPTKTLTFKLRQCFDSKHEGAKSQDDFAESLQYTPVELEKESDEFVESLGFLNSPFTFERDQLALFLRTLHDVVGGDGKEEDEAVQVADDGMQFIE